VNRESRTRWAAEALTTLRLMAVTLFACSLVYPSVVRALARICTPYTAEGWLLVDGQGAVIGSEIIAQPFSRPGYFWPRPSAVGYDGTSSGGSNLAATSGQLRRNAVAGIERLAGGPGRPVPADLLTSSGSGLDPHLSPASAVVQIERVAKARGISVDQLKPVVDQFIEGRDLGFLGEPRVNVLALNLALDEKFPVR